MEFWYLKLSILCRYILKSVSELKHTQCHSYWSGALISPSWIVTTASCSYGDNAKVTPDTVHVVLGEETLGQSSNYFKVSDVSQVVTHPDYSSSTKANNIALWKLSSPVSVETYTRMCLPAQDSTVAGNVKLVGWRISEVVGSLSQSLQETSTSVVSSSDCGASSDIVCTGTNTRCQGDVGAPLVQVLFLINITLTWPWHELKENMIS